MRQVRDRSGEALGRLFAKVSLSTVTLKGPTMLKPLIAAASALAGSTSAVALGR